MSIVNSVLSKFKESGFFLKLFLGIFNLFQKLGIHITPNHYYMPIPDTAKLKDDLWLKKSELVGIDMNEKGQIELLSAFVSNYREEYESLPRQYTGVQHQYYVNNRDFGRVDGEILYCMIRHFKPERIFEIGSGHSTYLSAQALTKNKELGEGEGELIAIEPNPRGALKVGFPGLTKLIAIEVQELDLSFFDELKENDILFIDSSHVLKIGGDVQFEYLEILPRLNEGVIVHLHDIFLPGEYPRKWVFEQFRFWNEQYLLQAFLAFNQSFKVLWAGNYMHINHPEKLTSAFNTYSPQSVFPGSFWMRKIK